MIENHTVDASDLNSTASSCNIRDFREIVGIALNGGSVESETLNAVTVGAIEASSSSPSPIK